METWEESSCLIFKEKEPSDRNYLFFTIKPCGCCSHVGMTGKVKQEISIAKNCYTSGIVMHELGHAIGFWHEHSRPDRDEYVDILLDNVKDLHKSNFNVKNYSEVDSLGEPYDFGSIMHYNTHQFAKESTKGRRLWIEFNTTDIEDKFTADYVILCGGDLQKDDDVIVSPNYPGDYLPDGHCVWNITVQAGFVVALTFEYLDMADYDKCANDFLEV
ncbi:Dorsal-ventral patterning tolloid-like protein 1 [Bulinus truncatus]|nr:Dorsal-ventral patterning tolloid-like protein 1 [Bulinus truncatus]